MTATHTHPDDAPTPGAPFTRLLSLSFSALTLYWAISLFRDPFPFPVREVAVGLLIAVVLIGRLRGWIQLVRASRPRPYVRSAVRTILAAAFVYVFFRETYFDPLPGLLGSALALLIMPMLLGLVTWNIAKSQDEVFRASAFESFAWGALVGIGLIYASIIALRFAPSISDWLQAGAADASSGLSPAGVGFAMGAAFSVVVVWMSLFASWAIWWARKR